MSNEPTQPLTEHRVREIVAEMIDAWQKEMCVLLDGPTQRMRDLMAAQSGEAN